MDVATTGDEHKRRQRMRSLAIGLALGGLVIVFYVATIVRLGPNALNKGGMRPNAPAPAVTVPTQQAPK
jgi:hypothetical protein